MQAQHHLVRNLRIGGGLVCFGLGAVGAVTPGLPTTVFVIIGSWLLTKSAPDLERKLVQSRLLGPYTKYLDPNVTIHRSIRLKALTMMWSSISVSLIWLIHAGASGILIGCVLSAGMLGSIAIWNFRRPRQ